MAEKSKKPVYIGPATSKVVNPLTGEPMEINEVYYDAFTRQPLIYGKHPIDEYDIENPWSGPASTYPNGVYKEVIDYNTVPENYVGSEVLSNYTYNPINDFNLIGLDKALYGVRGGDGKAYQGDFTKDFMLGFIPKLADPTSYARLAYDAAFDRENMAQNYIDGIGLVSRDFYNEHPYISEAINLAGGLAVPTVGGRLGRILSRNAINAPRTAAGAFSRGLAQGNRAASEYLASKANNVLNMVRPAAITPDGRIVSLMTTVVSPEAVQKGLLAAEAVLGGGLVGYTGSKIADRLYNINGDVVTDTESTGANPAGAPMEKDRSLPLEPTEDKKVQEPKVGEVVLVGQQTPVGTNVSYEGNLSQSGEIETKDEIETNQKDPDEPSRDNNGQKDGDPKKQGWLRRKVDRILKKSKKTTLQGGLAPTLASESGELSQGRRMIQSISKGYNKFNKSRWLPTTGYVRHFWPSLGRDITILGGLGYFNKPKNSPEDYYPSLMDIPGGIGAAFGIFENNSKNAANRAIKTYLEVTGKNTVPTLKVNSETTIKDSYSAEDSKSLDDLEVSKDSVDKTMLYLLLELENINNR